MGIYQDYKKTFDWFALMLVYGLLVWLLPYIALFGFRGAESQFNVSLVSFYYGSTIPLLLISLGEFIQFLSRKDKRIYDAIGWWGSVIVNPEMSILYNKKTNDYYKGFRWLKKTSVLLWLGLIVFSIFGIFAVIYNTFLTTLPFQTTQQIYALGEAILEVEPAGSEILGLVFILSMNMFLWKWIQKKAEFEDSIYWAIAMPISIILGIFYGVILHFFRYGSSDQSLYAVAIFWFTCTLLIIIFANIFIVWLFKDLNNLFRWLNIKFADETTAIYIGFFIAFVFLVGIFIFLIKRAKAKNKLKFLDLGVASGKA